MLRRSQLDEIEKGTADLERQLRAATTALEDEEMESETRAATGTDAEKRERIELRSRASLGNFLIAAGRGRMVDGAEAELCAAAWPDGRPAGASASALPMEIFDVPQPESRSENDNRETRAVAAVPGTVGVNLDPIRPAIFANSIAPRLGLQLPRVESGTYATGTITGSQSAAAQAKSGEAMGAAGAITVVTATPKRISARLELTLEDIAAVGQANYEAILRENLSLAISDELDDQAINGDGNGNDLIGIFERLDNPAAPAAAVETWPRFLAIQSGGIDGLWAAELNQIGLVVNPETFRLAAATFQGTDSEESAASYLKRVGGGFWTNKRMPDKTGHIAQGILYRMGRSAMGAGGGMRTAVCPHWNVIDIDDIYSGSAKGERYFTMHVLIGDVILVQPDAYAQVAFRVSV